MIGRKQIRAGDIIFLVNGKDVRGLPTKDVVDLIKGIPETKVELLIGRREACVSPPTEQTSLQNPKKIQQPPQPFPSPSSTPEHAGSPQPLQNFTPPQKSKSRCAPISITLPSPWKRKKSGTSPRYVLDQWW